VKLIPAPLGAVLIPAEVSVTALAGARPCLLVPATSGDVSIPLLRLGPQAELGRILHKLVEDAGRGRMSASDDADAAVREHFEVLIRERQLELNKDPFSKPYADLREAFSFFDWHSRTETAIAEADRLIDHRRLSDSGSRLQVVPSIASGDLGVLLSRAGEFRLFEVPFRSKNLRLRGRIDEVVRQRNGTVGVIDYKTGRVLEDDGNLSAGIAFQLGLYGLAILQHLPHAIVLPRVRSGEQDYGVPFTAEDIQRIESEHQALLSRLPVGQPQAALSLAAVGPHCRMCRIRHVCPLYRRETASLWARPIADFCLALDIRGSILRREKADDGTHTLTLRDAAGRLVKIHRLGLSEDDLETLMGFREVWFFNLCSHEGGFKGGSWHHPRNFYELPASRGESRAWSMEAFGSNADDLDT
jgi:hypothetical protein